MKILATYCSKDKNESKTPLPAVELYMDERIYQLAALAIRNNSPFYILSGKYGLIRGDSHIRYYDHLLTEDEVAAHSKLVADQIKDDGITEIHFYGESIEKDPNVKAYYKCLNNAAENSGIMLEINYL